MLVEEKSLFENISDHKNKITFVVCKQNVHHLSLLLKSHSLKTTAYNRCGSETLECLTKVTEISSIQKYFIFPKGS